MLFFGEEDEPLYISQPQTLPVLSVFGYEAPQEVAGTAAGARRMQPEFVLQPSHGLCSVTLQQSPSSLPGSSVGNWSFGPDGLRGPHPDSLRYKRSRISLLRPTVLVWIGKLKVSRGRDQPKLIWNDCGRSRAGTEAMGILGLWSEAGRG